MIKKVISHKVCHPEAPERLRPTGEGPPVTTTNALRSIPPSVPKLAASARQSCLSHADLLQYAWLLLIKNYLGESKNYLG